MSDSQYMMAPGTSLDDMSIRRKIALALMQQGTDTAHVQHWTQGAARMLQGGLGGYELYKARQDENDVQAKQALLYQSFLPGGQGGAMPSASPQPSAPRGVPMAGGEITSPQSAPVKDVYSPDEQSPLDPVPGAITPNRAKLLAAIMPGESGGRPDVMYGGRTFDSFADHPRQANPIMSGPNAGKTSSAAGTYQFIAPTWDRAKNALGLPDFTPQNQNAAAAYIAGNDYQKRTGQDLDKSLEAAGNDPRALNAIGRALSPTWTSLPGGIEPNGATGSFVNNMQRGTQVASLDPSIGIGQQVQAPQAPAGPQFAQAGGGVTQPQAASPISRIREMLASPDPNMRAAAMKMAAPYVAKAVAPPEFNITSKDYGTEYANKNDPNDIRFIANPGRAKVAAQFEGDKKTAEKIAERVATQGMPATSEEASALRKEVQQLPSYKNVTQAVPIYKTMMDSAGRDTRASDLNLVYGLGKIFDPGSVVREGEMVMVKNTASLPDWLVGAANSLNGGAALQPATRDAIMKEAHSRMTSYKQAFDQDVGMYRGIADRNRMLHDDVIPNLGEFPEFVRKPVQPAPAPAKAGIAPAQGDSSIDLLLKKYGGAK